MLEAEAYLREVVRQDVPTFGICFGHQILAQALGGEVRRNPRGREIGTRRIEKLADDPIFDGIPDVFDANVTHIDTVVVLPRGATALAKNDLEDHHAIRFTETCYGVQFHPELDADVMRSYIEHRWEILAAEGFDVAKLHAAIDEAELGRRTIKNFIRHVLPRKKPAESVPLTSGALRYVRIFRLTGESARATRPSARLAQPRRGLLSGGRGALGGLVSRERDAQVAALEQPKQLVDDLFAGPHRRPAGALGQDLLQCARR